MTRSISSPTLLRAYFASVCEKLAMKQPVKSGEMTRLMVEYALSPSVYCRENALAALAAFGNAAAIVEVFRRLSERGIQHNRKLVTDGLLDFNGDADKLVEELFANRNQFSIGHQAAIIDYFRFKGEKLKYKLIEPLKNLDTETEIVCALLRYYKKYPIEAYRPIILSWLTSEQVQQWECKAAAATALVSYPGAGTITALKGALHSKYWHVRRNAAISLGSMDVAADQIEDILQGSDKYAREQLVYHLTNKGGTR